MPAPTDLNARIALANGWVRVCSRTWLCDSIGCKKEEGEACQVCDYSREDWTDPEGQKDDPPDYVGTMGGVAGMMRELNEAAKPDWWDWAYFAGDSELLRKRYYVVRRTPTYEVLAVFKSPSDRPGDCVGDAWLSVFEKEAADAS